MFAAIRIIQADYLTIDAIQFPQTVNPVPLCVWLCYFTKLTARMHGYPDERGLRLNRIRLAGSYTFTLERRQKANSAKSAHKTTDPPCLFEALATHIFTTALWKDTNRCLPNTLSPSQTVIQ